MVPMCYSGSGRGLRCIFVQAHHGNKKTKPSSGCINIDHTTSVLTVTGMKSHLSNVSNCYNWMLCLLVDVWQARLSGRFWSCTVSRLVDCILMWPWPPLRHLLSFYLLVSVLINIRNINHQLLVDFATTNLFIIPIDRLSIIITVKYYF